MSEAVSGSELHGVWCPVLTPLDADLGPDAGRLVAHARWVLERGCHGIGLFGTTGEATSFSLDERTRALDALLEAGLPPERIMLGCGCAALTDTVRLAAHALVAGVRNLLMLPPFYYKNLSDDGLVATYDTVLQRLGTADLRLVFYHFPKLSGVPITLATIERLLAAYPETIAGVKDSSGDGAHTRKLILEFPQLAIFPGTETLLLPALEIGGAGCISASCNVNPGAIRATYDAFATGSARAPALQEDITRVRKALERRPMIPVMKFLLAGAHHDPAWKRVRPPLVSLPDSEGEALRTELDALDWRLRP